MSRTMFLRKKQGKGFAYFDGDEKITDEKILVHIATLAIPPAWRDVRIARSPRAKVQATGYDAAGRKQAIYSPAHHAKQDAAKFQRITTFATRLPAMRKQVERDLARRKLSKEKVLACIVKLMDTAYFRVGNSAYAKQHQTYGITTLRSKHADITTTSVTFDFTGKSGQPQHKKISDRQIAGIIRQLDELPGYEIFKYSDKRGALHAINSGDVNAYIKRHMGGEYTAKDFRTWGATLLAATELALSERPAAGAKRRKAVVTCVKNVAHQLGNTVAVTRNSYIDPRIIQAYERSDILAETRQTIAHMRPRRYLQPEEQCVLRVLEN